MFGIGAQELLIILVIALMVGIPAWCAWQVAKKAGFAPAWGLLIIVPLANLVILWIFAFSKWPALEPPSPLPPDTRLKLSRGQE